MAFKQGNNPLSRKTSPMRRSPFRQEASVSMEDLKKMSAKQDAESKAQALKLPQIEKPGFDYEMDQDMSYPGGERGRDYDEDGLKDLKKDGMSRKESPLNIDGGKAKHEKHIGRKLDDQTWGGHTQTEKHHRGPSRKGSPARMDASYNDAPMEFNKGLKKAQRQGKLSGEFNTLVKNSSVSRKASPVNNINYGTGYIGDKSKISYNENHVPQREMAAGKKSPNSRKKYY